jgi:hypothetical protein
LVFHAPLTGLLEADGCGNEKYRKREADQRESQPSRELSAAVSWTCL